MDEGEAIMERSMRDVPHNVDYSSAGLVAGTRKIFGRNPTHRV